MQRTVSISTGELGAVVFGLAFSVYAATAAPAMAWLDSPEFIASAASLGIPHSPGHPLAPILGRLFTLLPIGDMAFRVNLLSSAAAGGAALCLYFVIRAVTRSTVPNFSALSVDLTSAGAALIYAFSSAAWIEAGRAEVYSIVSLLILATFALVLGCSHSRSPGGLRAAGLLAGLALATHHVIAVVAIAPLAAYVLLLPKEQRPNSKRIAIVTAMVFVGLLLFLYLPVRAAVDPLVNWGDPDTLERIVWTISAQAFHKTTTLAHASSFGQDFAQTVWAVVWGVGVATFFLAILGFYLGMRHRAGRRLVLTLAAVALLTCLVRVVLGFDPETPDHHAYLLPAIAAVVALSIVAVVTLIDTFSADRRATYAAAVLAVVLAGLQLSDHAAEANQRDSYTADQFARWEVASIPPRALVLNAYFQTSFRVWALQTVEGLRPDVTFLDRSFLTYPGMPEAAVKRHPELATLIDAPLAAGQPSPLALLDQTLTTRPILVQLHPNVDRFLDDRLLPFGPYALYTRRSDPDSREESELLDDRARKRVGALVTGGESVDQRGIVQALLWHDFVRLQHYCRAARMSAAKRALFAALTISPDDEMLLAVAEDCQIDPATIGF